MKSLSKLKNAFHNKKIKIYIFSKTTVTNGREITLSN